jgi:hypothetical protein
MRWWVCSLQLLLGLASAVVLRSDSRGTHENILLSQIRDSPKLEDQVPVFISPRNRVAQLNSQALGSLFVASYGSLSLITNGLLSFHFIFSIWYDTDCIENTTGTCLPSSCLAMTPSWLYYSGFQALRKTNTQTARWYHKSQFIFFKISRLKIEITRLNIKLE